MNFDNANAEPVNIGIELRQPNDAIMQAIPHRSIWSPHGTFPLSNNDQIVESSGFTVIEHLNNQPYNIPGAVTTYAYGFSEAGQLELESSSSTADVHPGQYMDSGSSNFIHIPEQWRNNRTADWGTPTGGYAFETHTAQHQSTVGLHPQQLTSPLLFTDLQASDMIVTGYEDFPLGSWVGVEFPISNSVENMATTYHGRVLEDDYVPGVNSDIPVADPNLHRLHQLDMDMSGMEPCVVSSPTQLQYKGRLSVTERGLHQKGSSRNQTEEQRLHAWLVRTNGGACEHAKLLKKKVSSKR
jgi:hypothetical protein